MGGGCVRVTYEAQAAIEMEMVSRNTSEVYPCQLRPVSESVHWGETAALPAVRSALEVGLKPLLASVVEDVLREKTLSDIGGKFHRSVARIVGEVSALISEESGLKDVALSGGCFQNRLLLSMTVEELRKRGLQPLLHRNAPTNDGGISLGQAVIGHYALK
jgi:hydrogenase maturation protein HypF